MFGASHFYKDGNARTRHTMQSLQTPRESRTAFVRSASEGARVALAVVLSLLIFASDLHSPFAAAVHVAYVLPVYIAARSSREWPLYLIVALCTGLREPGGTSASSSGRRQCARRWVGAA